MNFSQIKTIAIKFLPVLGLFAFIAFVANGIPKGSLIAGGDFFQAFSPHDYAPNHLFAWNNAFFGQGTFNTLTVTYPFYALLAFLQRLGLTSGQVSNTYVFLFLLGSFSAFYGGIKLIFPQINMRVRIGTSLLYALNPFVITVLTYPWGYSHHFLIYLFLPLLIGYFYAFLVNSAVNFRNVFTLLLVLVTAQITFNNLAFIAVTLLLELALLVALVAFKQVQLNRLLLQKMGWLVLAYFIAFIPLFLANRSVLTSYSSGPSGSAVFGSSLHDWLAYTSSTFLNVLMLTMDRFRFPWTSGTGAVFITSFYILVPAALVYLFVHAKEEARDRSVWLWYTLMLVFMAFAVRLYSFMKGINLIIYQLPGFTAFRSPDKVFVLLPLIYLSALVALLTRLKLKRNLEVLAIVLLLLSAYPFLDGTIRHELAPNGNESYRYITSIPEPYRQAQSVINSQDSSQTTNVLSLPFSVVNSYGWSNYPKWGFVGSDILAFLYRKGYVSANMSDNIAGGNIFSFRDYNDRGVVDAAEFTKILQQFSTEYIFWHKDINRNWTTQTKVTKATLDSLLADGTLSLASDNDYFSLYKLAPTNVMPVLSAEGSPTTFKRVNPTKYTAEVTLPRLMPLTVTLNQTYNPNWEVVKSAGLGTCTQMVSYQASPVKECITTAKQFSLTDAKQIRGTEVIPVVEHKQDKSYANKWVIGEDTVAKIGRTNADGSVTVPLTLFFKPQAYWVVQIIWSGLLAFGAIVGMVLFRKKK